MLVLLKILFVLIGIILVISTKMDFVTTINKWAIVVLKNQFKIDEKFIGFINKRNILSNLIM